MIGQTISHYTILQKLGSGGVGVVYKARDLKLDRLVALKFLPSYSENNEEEISRFTREAKTASSLDHPNICTIYEIDETEPAPGEPGGGRMFIAMACYEGETLKKKITSDPFSVRKAAAIAVQIADGLAKAHENGIIHRDIKPANIIVTPDGIVKIVDFGLAKLANDAGLTRTGAMLGTVAYMSPEQAHGEKVDARTDIWSLGVVLYEMLTGQLPFQGEYEQAVIYSILNREPVPLSSPRSNIPAEIEQIVNKALRKRGSERYQNMDEMLADLGAELKGAAGFFTKKRVHRRRSLFPFGKREFKRVQTAVAPSPASPQKMPATPARKNRNRFFGLAGALIFASLAILFMTKFGGPEESRLVVLPFTLNTEASNAEALSMALFHDVTALLTTPPFRNTVRVIPANEVLDAGVINTRQADSAFVVARTLTGNIQHSGNSVRLVLTLVDAASLIGLNSMTIEAEMHNLLVFQNEMAGKLAELFEIEITPESSQLISAGGTTIPGAYEFYLQGRGYLQQFTNEGKVDAAITLFQQAVAEDSSYALAHAGLGEAWLRKYERTRDKAWIDKAFQSAEHALTLDNRLSPAYFTRGLYFNIRGRYSEAEAAFQQALQMNPNDAASHRGLATSCLKLNKIDLAEKSYKKAIALEPKNWSGYNDLGMFYEKEGRYRDAVEQFSSVVKLTPDNAWGYHNLGVQYHNLGRLDEAAEWHGKAMEVKPENAEVIARSSYSLGGIFYVQDNFPEAARMYTRSLALNNDMWGWQMLANARFHAGEQDSARIAWKRAILLAKDRLKVNPAHQDARIILACAYAMLRERKQALPAIGRLLALKHQNFNVYLQVGVAYEALGERELALKYIETALEKGLDSERIEGSQWLNQLRGDPRYKTRMRLEGKP